jgi:hypothetical protein
MGKITPVCTVILCLFIHSAALAGLDVTSDGAQGMVGDGIFVHLNTGNMGSGTANECFKVLGGSGAGSVQLGQIPTVHVGNTLYREFVLNLKEQDRDRAITLTTFTVTIDSVFIYGLTDSVAMIDAASPDYSILIPSASFTGTDTTQIDLNVVFSNADNGPEEVMVGVGSNSVTPTSVVDGTSVTVIPEPATLILLALGSLTLLRKRK